MFYYILGGTRDVGASVGGFSISCVFFLGTIHSQSQVILLGMDECQLLIRMGYMGKHRSYDYVSTCMILLGKNSIGKHILLQLSELVGTPDYAGMCQFIISI